MPLPSCGWERRGASWPPCPVPLGAVPTGGKAAVCPGPHGMPAAARSGMNTISAQEIEGRDYCPHSTLVRTHLRLASGFGTASAENSREGRRVDEAEETGEGRLPWSGAGSAWGGGSVGGSLQLWLHPEAGLSTEMPGERLRDGGRDWKHESGRTHPGLLPGRWSRPAGGRELGTALPLHRPSKGTLPRFALSGTVEAVPRPRVGAVLTSRRGLHLPFSFLPVVRLQAGLSKKWLLQSSLFPPVTRGFPCPYHWGRVSAFEVESFITFPELGLSCSADRPGYVSTRSLISARAGGTLESHFR